LTRSYVWFEKIGDELCPVFFGSGEKLIFAIVEEDKVDFFLVIIVRLVWKRNLGREA
jgi:hypothetical protein